MILISQVIGIIFVLAMFYFTYLEYKRKHLSKFMFLFWSLTWIAAIILLVFRDAINTVLPQVSLIRVMDLYMILAFMFLFVIIFYLTVRNNKIEKRLEKLTRTIALKPIIKDKGMK